jgi:hypothetical protein
MASATLDLAGHAKMEVFMQALASGSVQAGLIPLPGVSVKASAGISAGVEISQSESFGLGHGLSGAQTTTFEAKVVAGASGEASFGLTGGELKGAASYGARVGEYVSIGEDVKFELGPVDLDSSGTIMSPGVLGYSTNISIGIDADHISLGFDQFLGAELFGFEFKFNVSIDTSMVTHALEDAGNKIKDGFVTFGNDVKNGFTDFGNAIASGY